MSRSQTLGLVLLLVGGKMLVRGAVACANSLGVPPLLIGLTLVGFGTSTPELVTSVTAALNGLPGIAVGNVVGSNIANILFILGASAIIYPLAVNPLGFKRDAIMVACMLKKSAYPMKPLLYRSIVQRMRGQGPLINGPLLRLQW
jgi:Ca2+/Na+ antiporter